MKQSNEIEINLGRMLSKGLYPLSLGIGLLISLCFPITYYLLEYKGCERSASYYAKKTADKFQETILIYPKLWKYQIYLFTQIERELSQGSDVISLRVYDHRNLLIPNYSFQQSEDSDTWWNKWAPKGSADIFFNNEVVGRVEIEITQKILLLKTALLFLVSTTVGLLLAVLSYQIPIRVVQKLEAELQEQFDNIQRAHKESDHLKHEAQESEKRFRDLVDGLDAIVWEADADTKRFSFISQQVEKLFQYSINDWLSAADFFKEQIFPDDREKVLEAYNKSIGMETDCQLEYRRVSKNGSIIWVRDNIRIINVEAKKKQLRGVFVDVTNKHQAEEALNKINLELNRSVKQLEQHNWEITALHEMSEMFQLCRDRGEAYRIIGVAAKKLFPKDSGALYLLNPSENMLDLSCSFGEVLKHEPHFLPDSCWALRRRSATWTSGDNKLTCNNKYGETANHCFCIPLLSQGEIIGIFHLELTSGDSQNGLENNEYETKYQLAISMTEHVAMAIANLSLRETLHYLSIRDPLTSLFNRRYMEDALMRELVMAERKKRTLGIIMLDLDHFKCFNDLHGHDAGDTMLREFGRFLFNNIREYDIACRYGGEEFICILPETTLEKALERAEEIRSNLKYFKVEHLGCPLETVTISAGVAIYPLHGTTAATIVKAADEALYLAKEQGRNRIVAATAKGGLVQKKNH